MSALPLLSDGKSTYIVAANDAVYELHGAVQGNVEQKDIEEQCP